MKAIIKIISTAIVSILGLISIAKFITIKKAEFYVLEEHSEQLQSLLAQILAHDNNYKKICEGK